jgi:hypothetical protein
MELTVHVQLDDVLKLIQQAPEEDFAKIQEEVAKRKEQTASSPTRGKRQFGTMKGLVIYMAPDFDEELEDFEEYM